MNYFIKISSDSNKNWAIWEMDMVPLHARVVAYSDKLNYWSREYREFGNAGADLILGDCRFKARKYKYDVLTTEEYILEIL